MTSALLYNLTGLHEAIFKVISRCPTAHVIMEWTSNDINVQVPDEDADRLTRACDDLDVDYKMV